MSDRWITCEARLMDLLADRTVFGLGDEEQEELDALTQMMPEVDPQCMERAAAVVCLAGSDTRLEPLPASIQKRLRRAALEGPSKS